MIAWLGKAYRVQAVPVQSSSGEQRVAVSCAEFGQSGANDSGG